MFYNLVFSMFDVHSTLLNSIAGFILNMRKCGTERLYNMPTFTGLNFRCSGSKSNVLPLYAHPCSDPKLPAHHGSGSCNLHYFTASHPNSKASPLMRLKGRNTGVVDRFKGVESRKSKIRLHLPFLCQCKLGWHWE